MPNSSRSPPLQNAGPAPLSSTDLDRLVGLADEQRVEQRLPHPGAERVAPRRGRQGRSTAAPPSRLTLHRLGGRLAAARRATLAEPAGELRPAEQQRVGRGLGREARRRYRGAAVCRTSCPHAIAARGDRSTAARSRRAPRPGGSRPGDVAGPGPAHAVRAFRRPMGRSASASRRRASAWLPR